MQRITHATFCMLVWGAWACATQDMQNKFLSALFGDDDDDRAGQGGVEQVLEYFEDTRGADEVNKMLVAFTQLDMLQWVWDEEEECYTHAA